MSKDLVTKWFNKIPTSEQNMPLLIVGGIAYTPRQTLDEVTRGTPLGDQLQSLIEQDKFGTTFADEQALIKQRLTQSLLSKPQDKIMFATLPSFGVGLKTFTPKELLQEINNNTAIGRQWTNNEANYMRRLIQAR